MSSSYRDFVFMILQFLKDAHFKETVHKLEQESGFFFNMKYFEDQVLSGNWDEVERYISGFIKFDYNPYSRMIVWEIRKQKYLEALDKKDHSKAIDILIQDLKVFASVYKDLFKDITQLLILENFRQHEKFSEFGDTQSMRKSLLNELKKHIEGNPSFHGKLHFPSLEKDRLWTLFNKSLKPEHRFCENQRLNTDKNALLVGHTRGQSSGTHPQLPAYYQFLPSIQTARGFSPLGAHGSFQPILPKVSMPHAGWIYDPSTVTHPAISGRGIGLCTPTNPATILKHPRPTPTNNLAIDYPSGDPDHTSKRTRQIGISDEVNLPANIFPAMNPVQNHSQPFNMPDDLPMIVARTLKQGSLPMSMDFHPVQHTLVLVGTNVGDIGLWEVGSGERIFHKTFNVWDHGASSVPLQAALVKDSHVSINRITWSPDGSLFGAAYSEHIVHLYSYHGDCDVQQRLQIDAHVGSVNDLAFSHPNGNLFVLTCGDDKFIKVWDAATGVIQYTFEGHKAAVYCVCPHFSRNIQFFLSTALDGKIKGWLYENSGSKVEYGFPGYYFTTMAYSADGLRLFSCGTSKYGNSCIVEWNERTVERIYLGFQKLSLGVVQIDTTKNRFLAAGDEFAIKFWDMNKINILTTTNADGGLPESPSIRFNKEGTLLAVSANEDGFKILANADGLRLLHISENFKSSRVVSKSVPKTIRTSISASADATTSGVDGRVLVVPIAGMNEGTRNLGDVEPTLTKAANERSKIQKLTEINEPAQCRSLRLLSDGLRTNKISRLIYTNLGDSILALASNGIHLLWKWPGNNSNLSGKATASVPPLLWKPPSGKVMTNDITDTNPEEAVPCFALSRNDDYVVSASGGKISLFYMKKFETMATFMPPPPAATFLALFPQDNNIIVIGMDDSTILVYNVHEDKVKEKLQGHSKKITSLTFSQTLNVLVSSGADDQICVWNSEGWEKQNSRFLQLPAGKIPEAVSETRLQFHKDQVHFLVVHETQLAIYEATKLEYVKLWVPRDSPAPISHATFSCDSQLVYASLLDATIYIFSTAKLRLRCRINPTAYLPATVSSTVYPLEIAAHPSEANQFALGLTDGEVLVFEPLESEGKWGLSPPVVNQSESTMPTAPTVGASSSEQLQR